MTAIIATLLAATVFGGLLALPERKPVRLRAPRRDR